MSENYELWTVRGGSWAFGMNTPESDIDLLTVYAVPTRDILSGVNMGGGSHEVHGDEKAGQWYGCNVDRASHEAGKLVAMYLKGNINFMMSVWSPIVESESAAPVTEYVPIGDEIPSGKNSWLKSFRFIAGQNMAKNLVHSCFGIAANMVNDGHKYNNGAPTFTAAEMQKKYRLALRLLGFCAHWLMGDGPTFYPISREIEWTAADVVETVKEVKRLYEASPLPETPDAAPFHEWLFRVRIRYLNYPESLHGVVP